MPTRKKPAKKPARTTKQRSAFAPDGFIVVKASDVTDQALLPRRFDMFVAEAHEAFNAAKDTQESINFLGGQILPLLEDIRNELKSHAARLAALEKAKAAHAEQLKQQAEQHTQHDGHITGIHKRLVIIEQSITTTTKADPT